MISDMVNSLPFQGQPRRASVLPSGPERKNSVVADRRTSTQLGLGADRRRSSAGGMFLDYEETTKRFLDAQVKLTISGRMLNELDAKHKELQTNFETLSRRYIEAKSDALEVSVRWY